MSVQPVNRVQRPVNVFSLRRCSKCHAIVMQEGPGRFFGNSCHSVSQQLGTYTQLQTIFFQRRLAYMLARTKGA